MGVAIGLGIIASFIVGGAVGFYVGVLADNKGNLRELGFTRKAAGLYRRAAKLLNRMVTITDLDGDFAADILSPETRKQVDQWLADYRKEINSQ